MKFVLVIVNSKCLNFKGSADCSCHFFLHSCDDTTIYLVFPAFASGQSSLLAAVRASLLFFMVFMSCPKQIYFIRIRRNLCLVQFESQLFGGGLPNGTKGMQKI